jgi:hypothetical protein
LENARYFFYQYSRQSTLDKSLKPWFDFWGISVIGQQ